MSHPARVGVWRFTLAGGVATVEDVGHTADEALARARVGLRGMLKREPSWNDIEKSELVADDCMTPIVEMVARAWDIEPSKLLAAGPKTRQRVEARAACLVLARARFGNDVGLLAKATGWPVDAVRDVLKYADGRGGRKVRERVERMSTPIEPPAAAAGATP